MSTVEAGKGQGLDFLLPPPELLPVLGLLERYMTPTLDAALLYSSRAGSDLGQTSDYSYLKHMYVRVGTL